MVSRRFFTLKVLCRTCIKISKRCCFVHLLVVVVVVVVVVVFAAFDKPRVSKFITSIN